MSISSQVESTSLNIYEAFHLSLFSSNFTKTLRVLEKPLPSPNSFVIIHNQLPTLHAYNKVIFISGNLRFSLFYIIWLEYKEFDKWLMILVRLQKVGK